MTDTDPNPSARPDHDETAPVSFEALPLEPALIAAVHQLGFESATPIQGAAIPVMLEGHDLIGRARTGSGKTAAFGLPLLHLVREGGSPPRALVMTPTRELALQVTEALRSFAKGLPIRIATVYGGAPYPPQIQALRSASVVVGTPGRLIDHLGRGTLDLGQIEVFVLDEADEMLRMGFIDDVSTLLASTPETRQVALFSATMPKEIRKIAEEHLRDAVEVQVEEQALTVQHIEQQWMRVPHRHKLEALMRVLRATEHEAVLVFARTKAGCAEVADELTRRGFAVDALHGDLSQSARERVVQRLRARRLNVVIATDVAARGLDVDHITHVINLDLPLDTETYVHRIGRTGRGGRVGNAITFATPKEKQRIRQFARMLDAPLNQGEIPTDADIAVRQQAALKQRLVQAHERVDEQTLAWVTELVEEGALDLQALAAAAVRMCAESDGTPLTPIPEGAPPPWARPVTGHHPHPSASAPPADDVNEVQLFLPVGRRRNVRPGDIVGALANEAGVDGRRIGRVNILDRKTFVGVPQEVATTILDRLSQVQIRGQDVPVALARPGSASEVEYRGSPRTDRDRRNGGRRSPRRNRL